MPQVERIDDYRWRIPRQGGMRTEGLIFADEQLMRDLEGDQAVQQVANVAHLPGIVGPAIAMPDIHWGYGFPIGGVAAFDDAAGVVSPGSGARVSSARSGAVTTSWRSATSPSATTSAWPIAWAWGRRR